MLLRFHDRRVVLTEYFSYARSLPLNKPLSLSNSTVLLLFRDMLPLHQIPCLLRSLQLQYAVALSSTSKVNCCFMYFAEHASLNILRTLLTFAFIE